LCFVCMDVVALVSGCFIRNKKGVTRKVSKVLSNALEPLSMSAVHYPAKNVSEIRVAKEPRYRRCIAVDETATCMHMCGLL